MGTPQTYTPSEAAAFARTDSNRVRKELEYKIIPASSPPRLKFADLVYLRALVLTDLHLSRDDRANIYQRIAEAMARSERPDSVEIAQLVTLAVRPVVEELEAKIAAFTEWKERLVRDPDVMGGAEVFPDSRLTVRQIGGLVVRGEERAEILEDYPYLTDHDLEFAELFVRAYPRVGRPRRSDSDPDR